MVTVDFQKTEEAGGHWWGLPSKPHRNVVLFAAMTAKKELSEQAKALLQLIPPDGSFVGNTYLRRKSSLSDEEYWKVRNELEEAALITLGRGRGGSVALQLLVTPVAPVAPAAGNLVHDESDLYEPLKKLLNDDWGKEAKQTEDFFELRITASPRGRQRDSGQWSRPDLTLVEVSTYDYIPGSNLEITTFEVKRFDDAQNIASVYEAAAHSRWAHYAFLVAEVPTTSLNSRSASYRSSNDSESG